MHHQLHPDRRHFLSLAAASLISAHALSATSTTQSGGARPAAGPRILSMELQTAVPLPRMKEFYHRSLGLRVLEDSRDHLTLAAGDTRFTFVPTTADGQPFYHFAFNIPENKIRAALQWQRERSALIPIPERLRDPNYPAEVVDYNHWNAHSIFFFDPAENVVEYIARHDLRNSAEGAFTSRDILYASEIGLIVDDVTATAGRLREAAGLDQYRDGSDQFRAIGDEHGLLLIMRRGRIISFDSPQRKAVDVFRTRVRARGTRRSTFRVEGFPYEVEIGG